MTASEISDHESHHPLLSPISLRALVVALVISIIGIRQETASQLLRGGVSLELQLPWLVLFVLGAAAWPLAEAA